MEELRQINEKLFQMQKQMESMSFSLAQLMADMAGTDESSNNPKELNQSRAAKFLNTNSQLLIRLRDKGFLHPRKQGGLWMYKVRELENYKRRYQL